MAYVQVYRSNGARAVAVAVIAFSVVGSVSLLAAGRVDLLVGRAAPLVPLGVLAWLAYWRPSIQLDESGVTLQQVFRRVHIPWTAIQEIHSRYGMRLETAYGDFDAWAVPAPTGRDRARGGDNEAALMVRQRLERLRAHGQEPSTTDGSVQPEVHVDLPALAAFSVATALAVLGLLASLL